MSTSSKIYCGVDGGQTSTKCVIGTDDGQFLGAGRGGPLIHLSAEGGRERLVISINEAIDAALPQSQHYFRNEPIDVESASGIAGVVVGATGIFEDTIEAATATELLAPQLKTANLHVCSDALIALFGAHAGEPGIMVIAGTGTIAYGIDENGKVARAGGWGWPLGDGGSAFAIGRAAVQAALFGHDLLGPKTVLTGVMQQHFQVAEIHDIKRIYFAPDFGAPDFAALAPLVSQAARNGDLVAQKIISNSGDSLAKQAVAVAHKLAIAAEEIGVAPVGGAFEHVNGLQASFAQALRRSKAPAQQRLALSQPKFPPAVGAYLMAIQQDGKPITTRLISQIQGWDIVNVI